MKAILSGMGKARPTPGLRDDVASIALTARGERQAGQLAREWIEVPSLIVTSPFQRTRQTATPTIAVPVETWDIAEFTYPQPERWNVTVRLLPRWLGLEASGEFGIVKEVIEEAVPGLGGAACFSKHI